MTRVLDYGDESNYDPNKGTKSAWQVYRRLVGYALRYRGRLAAVIFLSFIVAFSFTSMILGVGAAIDLLYAKDATATATADRYAEGIANVFTNGEGEAYASNVNTT